MIVALFSLVVAIAAALVFIVLSAARSMSHTTAMFLAHLRTVERESRAERSLLLRAVLSRNGAEFGQLDRIRQQEADAAGESGPGRSLTPRQYADWLERDLHLGLGGESDIDPDIPLVPEGFGS